MRHETKSRKVDHEYTGQLIDVFEDYLEKKDVYVPNEERDFDGVDADIRLYGGDYTDIEAQINNIIVEWNGTPDVFVQEKEPLYADEFSQITPLLLPGECVAKICIEGEYFPREIIIPIDSDDIAGALEETLHRLLDHGLDPGLIGARQMEEGDDPDHWTDIDLGYGISGAILSIEYTRTERFWLRDFPDYIGRHYNINSDAMAFLNAFVKNWLTWQDEPYENLRDELKMFMTDFKVDHSVYDMVEEFQELED